MLPDGCVDVIWQQGRGAFLAGPDTGPVREEIAAGAVLVGIRFRPGAGGPALGVPLAEVRDQRVDLAEIRPSLAELLPPDLDPALATGSVLRLAQQLSSAMEEDAMVSRAAGLMARPQVRVESLAGQLGVSPRQLRRRFESAVGYGPKTLQRVLRFQSFLAAVSRAGESVNLADLALACGYWDQAHLTHECSDLAGLTPAQLALRASTTGSAPVGRSDRLSR